MYLQCTASSVCTHGWRNAAGIADDYDHGYGNNYNHEYGRGYYGDSYGNFHHSGSSAAAAASSSGGGSAAAAAASSGWSADYWHTTNDMNAEVEVSSRQLNTLPQLQAFLSCNNFSRKMLRSFGVVPLAKLGLAQHAYDLLILAVRHSVSGLATGHVCMC
jgi:hypothetical protein